MKGVEGTVANLWKSEKGTLVGDIWTETWMKREVNSLIEEHFWQKE